MAPRELWKLLFSVSERTSPSTVAAVWRDGRDDPVVARAAREAVAEGLGVLVITPAPRVPMWAMFAPATQADVDPELILGRRWRRFPDHLVPGHLVLQREVAWLSPRLRAWRGIVRGEVRSVHRPTRGGRGRYDNRSDDHHIEVGGDSDVEPVAHR